MRILAIETSCDETSIAIVDFTHFTQKEIRVLSHIILSQVALHKKFGGVVPSLAKREHQRNLVPILLEALKEARLHNTNFEIKISKLTQNSKFKIKHIEKILAREAVLLKQFKRRVFSLSPPPLDAIAVTSGPGLAPALWVGINFAKALAYLWNIPLIPINHMLGHLYSALLQPVDGFPNSKIRISKSIENPKFKFKNLRLPAIALLVSGGHTELILINQLPSRLAPTSQKSALTCKVIGETLDDAAGEAFDKAARILGLGYPGGPEISRLADSWKSYEVQGGKPHNTKVCLPRPMIHSNDYNFSFSGLKTAVLYLTRDLGLERTKQLRPLIAKEFQDAVVEVLVKKTIRAAKEFEVKTVLLGGGVAANKLLRQRLEEAVKRGLPDVRCQMSNVALAGDNALMIAVAAYFSGKKKALMSVKADVNARLGL